eukprot:4376787-Amphidinium_carterae.1
MNTCEVFAWYALETVTPGTQSSRKQRLKRALGNLLHAMGWLRYLGRVVKSIVVAVDSPWVPVRAKYLVPEDEEVAIIEGEQTMVHMMISRSAKPVGACSNGGGDA